MCVSTRIWFLPTLISFRPDGIRTIGASLSSEIISWSGSYAFWKSVRKIPSNATQRWIVRCFSLVYARLNAFIFRKSSPEYFSQSYVPITSSYRTSRFCTKLNNRACWIRMFVFVAVAGVPRLASWLAFASGIAGTVKRGHTVNVWWMSTFVSEAGARLFDHCHWIGIIALVRVNKKLFVW